VTDWTLHDLRRTFASGLQELGVDQMTIHACLNHSLGGLADVYMRAPMMGKKAEALRLWAAHIQMIIATKRA
jgi:integrase